jgi:hypothetical protein
MRSRFLPTLILGLMLSACVTSAVQKTSEAFPCERFTSLLGPSHQCPVNEGGALDEFAVRREITSQVILEGQPLAHQEYGKRALIFHSDGRYEARKLHFTRYFTGDGPAKRYLVYAEDSSGLYEVLKDGRIELQEPDWSTCAERKNGGSQTIAVHLQYEPRKEPYRSTHESVTRVVFDTGGWLKTFHGSDIWQGQAAQRGEVQWPPLASDKTLFKSYRFNGSSADVHYGCLNRGFAEFRGDIQLYLVEQLRFDEDVDPFRLKRGTRFHPSDGH